MCTSTVRTDRYSRAAMSRLVRPPGRLQGNFGLAAGEGLPRAGPLGFLGLVR
jgi:hypothetical protein